MYPESEGSSFRPRLLVYFDKSVTPTIERDAIVKGLGVFLLQNEKPVAFASKSLTDAETWCACIQR